MSRVPSQGLEAWEQRLWRSVRVVAGVDEAGRGPLAGPVVAAAFAALSKDVEATRLFIHIHEDTHIYIYVYETYIYIHDGIDVGS